MIDAQIKDFIKVYVLLLGIVLTITGLFEFFKPEIMFRTWSGWINSKYFYLHGLILIIFGFPLIMNESAISRVIFVIGVITVLIGPFILLYPDTVRNLFNSLKNDLDISGIKKLVYTDSVVRVSIGILFIVSYFI